MKRNEFTLIKLEKPMSPSFVVDILSGMALLFGGVKQ